MARGILAFWRAKLQDGLSWWQRCLPPCTDRHLCFGEQWTWNSKAIKGCLMIVCGVWLFMIKVVNLSLLNLAIAAGRQEKRPKMKLAEVSNISKSKCQVKLLLMEFQMMHLGLTSDYVPCKHFLIWGQLICPMLPAIACDILVSRLFWSQKCSRDGSRHSVVCNKLICVCLEMKQKIVPPGPCRKWMQRFKEVGSIWNWRHKVTNQRWSRSGKKVIVESN